jgi:hypothetical protein
MVNGMKCTGSVDLFWCGSYLVKAGDGCGVRLRAVGRL